MTPLQGDLRRVPPKSDREKLREKNSGKKHAPRLPLYDIRAHSDAVSHEGLRVRLSKLAGETPKDLLRAPLGLPAVLNEFTDEEEFAHTDYRTVSYGEFSVPIGGDGYHGRSLRRLPIEMCTLDWDAPWLQHRGYTDHDVRATLLALGRSKKPFRLGARAYRGEDAPFELRMDATLRRVSRSLRQDLDARWYTLEFVEWRDPTQRRRQHDPGRRGKHHLPAKHKLDADDTLHKLSKRYYNRYDRTDLLRKANGLGKWGVSTPIVQSKRFKVGDTFKIPALPRVKTHDNGGGVAVGDPRVGNG